MSPRWMRRLLPLRCRYRRSHHRAGRHLLCCRCPLMRLRPREGHLAHKRQLYWPRRVPDDYRRAKLWPHVCGSRLVSLRVLIRPTVQTYRRRSRSNSGMLSQKFLLTGIRQRRASNDSSLSRASTDLSFSIRISRPYPPRDTRAVEWRALTRANLRLLYSFATTVRGTAHHLWRLDQKQLSGS
jgi:hypothetical protein